ncbi:hypothetical protein ANN_06674 [Periplaneta americana]|uniref:Uncharacterized protein n=1 Tax=Periplaneta americana TaxID=6978 RepID=A0ABQ8TG22_PERAM|nr:hypothetical protein ANN_06674 [Periplaneta americana]
MVGLCKSDNESPGSLKAICKALKRVVSEPGSMCPPPPPPPPPAEEGTPSPSRSPSPADSTPEVVEETAEFVTTERSLMASSRGTEPAISEDHPVLSTDLETLHPLILYKHVRIVRDTHHAETTLIDEFPIARSPLEGVECFEEMMRIAVRLMFPDKTGTYNTVAN